MRIQISGKRGEGKTRLRNLLTEFLLQRRYNVYSKAQCEKEPDIDDIATEVIIIEEMFSETETEPTNKEK